VADYGFNNGLGYSGPGEAGFDTYVVNYVDSINWSQASSLITEPVICRGQSASGEVAYQVEDTQTDSVPGYEYLVGEVLCGLISDTTG
jgi:hypothetical protein